MTLFAADEPPPRRVRCGAGCGHWLTDPRSIALGAGPKCARELGLIPAPGPRIPTRCSTATPEPIPLEDPMACPTCHPDLAVPLRVRPGNRNPQNIYAALENGNEVLVAVATSPAAAVALIAAINGGDRG